MILQWLLFILILPRVWLKPTLDDSKLTIKNKDAVLRCKRQATFLDILHQAIDKYASCADEYLAPLKAIVNHKPYEIFIPKTYFPHEPAILSATAQTKPNKSNVKCSKVNLCSIKKQNYDSRTAGNKTPVTVGQVLSTNSNKTKLNIPKYFLINDKDKTKQPNFLPLKYNAKNSPPLYNPDFLKLFFNKLSKNQQQLLTATGPATVLAKNYSNPVTKCPCLNKTTKEDKLQSTQQRKNKKNYHKCPCLKTSDTPQLSNNNSLETDVKLGSIPNKTTLSCGSKEFEQNLDLLLMQLDEMAEGANNEELKIILETLKYFKSAVDKNFFNKTPIKYNFPNLDLNLRLLDKIFKPNSASKPPKAAGDTATFNNYSSDQKQADIQNSYLELDEDFIRSPNEDAVSREVNSSSLESYNLKDLAELITKTTADLKFNKTNFPDFFYHIKNKMDAAQPHEFIEKNYILDIPGTTELEFEIPRTANDRHYLRRNSINNKGYMEALTPSPPVLHLNHKYSENLPFTNFDNEQFENCYQDASFSHKTKPPLLMPDYSNKQTYFKRPENNHVLSVRAADNPKVSKDNFHLTVDKQKSVQKFSNLNSNLYKPNKEDSKITILITSKGNFKHINVEQDMPDDEQMQIQQKEKMNRDSYAEPILSEIYPGNLKSPLKRHLIEETYTKTKRCSNTVGQTFQSSDVLDSFNSDEENHQNILKDAKPNSKECDGELT